ncbi:hypothetical protein AB0Y04_07060 [Loigolactobacillus coryniformis]|jgi:flagellar biogenesis protein FliO|uniref:Uncharacterized protein n=3 Tax=Loigolactobacillus coryniformis TaxID=1610 RepID=A0A0R1F820_9LACO|nr:hypothetical protein [Loigolactobacillus coryniformis]MDT3391288.1 hypothetical protein [Bacillota bacterium]OEH90608.1 hypothetical protein ATO00_03170 [Loigolactobacillus coryniformis subsp. coryniformis]RRG05640.1 MAG: hypothetical protein DUD28_05475 [Lactobacillus sp.]ATO44495.1 hypothetical protein LC20004_11550 [Loigolactobacillus coryniformis subsp. torquens DSM 20004 = KCTC 3535]ATO56217.1 hypothetical protein LC20001_11555 [Loigolactobacillus coryniformis subsp. coryniformis KCTC 
MITLFVALFYLALVMVVGLVIYRIYLLVRHDQERGPLVSRYALYSAAAAMFCAIVIGALLRK